MTIKLLIEDDYIFWHRNNMHHNKYGPSIICIDDGSKAWYINGKWHRTNGPAIEYSCGVKEWYIDNVNYTYLEYIVEVEQLNANK